MALSPEEQAELDELENDPDLDENRDPADLSLKEEVTSSMPEAALRSAAQGATFGLSDEITAGAEAGLGYLQGKGLSDTYDKSLEESRAEYKQSEEDYPITSALGGIAGGVGQAVALTAASGGAAAPAAIGNLGKAIGVLKNVVNPIAKGGVLKKIGTMAAAGAAQGGLTALGRSEKKGLARTEDLPDGVLSGAVVGGGLSILGQGAGKLVKSAGASISKGIDEGKYPSFFRMIREGARSGSAGKGFSTEANQARTMNEAYDVAENVVKPELTTALTEIRELRNYIVDNADGIVDISIPLKSLNSKLKEIGFQDATDLRNGITKTLDSAQGKGFITLSDANRMAKYISEEIDSKPQLTARIKEVAYEAINDIKNQVRTRIPDHRALQILSDNPEMLARYAKYLREIPEDHMKQIIESTAKITPKEALEKAKEIKNIFKINSEVFKSEDPSVISDFITGPEMKEVLRLTSPIRELDNQMRGILNASEILGGVTTGKSEADQIRDIVKIFRNIVEQPKDSNTSFIARKRFEESMSQLREVVPNVAKKIEDAINPVVKDIQLQRYIEGSGFDKGNKESGFIKGALGDIGKLAAEGTNIAAQTLSAANKGTRGPLPLPTSTMLRPTTSVLQSVKQVSDEILASRPDSKMFAFISKHIETALAEKDEGRRAAILNTLMQYPTFRELFNLRKKEEATSGEE